MHPAIITLVPDTQKLAGKIAAALGGEIRHGAGQITAAYAAGQPVIGICAAAILIRKLAPLLDEKHTSSPVIAVSADGAHIVPLTGGHHGANTLARKIATITGGTAAITTASDTRFGVALDDPPAGYTLANPQDAKPFIMQLLNGEKVQIQAEAEWLKDSRLPTGPDATLSIDVTTSPACGGPDRLVYHPKTVCIGVGCARGAPSDELRQLVEDCLASAGLARQSVAVITSLDIKADEAAIGALAQSLKCPARFFDVETLNRQAARLANPSEIVMKEVGCPGVAEAACLAAAGPDGCLVVEKTKSASATCAIALAPSPVSQPPGSPRGYLAVTGIGPGSGEWRSPAAASALLAATDWVGYGLYLDLAASLSHGKTLHNFPLGDEEKRVRHAISLAGQGKNVALVCSGDAAIYAMAALVYEVLDTPGLSAPENRIEIDVIPGISAFQAASARAGALIGHDFCTISLSDLLTPWATIRARIEAAAQGDFNIAFYNPRSKKRTGHLGKAIDILKPARHSDTPVIIASNLGRPAETVRTVRLADFDPQDVDMLTIVLIGSSQSRLITRGDGETYCYTPRDYAAKRDKS